MIRWIRGAGLALLLAAALPGAATAEPARAPEKVQVTPAKVLIAGPKGYCIDRRGSSDRPDGAFVLLGHCDSLAGRPAPGKSTAARPADRAVLTVTAQPMALGAPPLEASFAAMGAYFQTEAGRAALSRAGKAGSVTVHSASSVGDVFYIQISDQSAARDLPVEPRYWRAILEVKGTMLTLTVQALAGARIADADQRALLEDFVRRIKQENR